jgi:metal-responsive CopG/Arc/MetJ family transcriptional regulator
MKRVLVSLPDGIKEIIDELRGKMGESDSEIVRTIVIAYLSEKGFLVKKGEGEK